MEALVKQCSLIISVFLLLPFLTSIWIINIGVICASLEAIFHLDDLNLTTSL